jgi:membrane protease YdiL (CAAX protease family)
MTEASEAGRGGPRKAGIFVALTFLLSWLLIGLYVSLGGKWVFPQAAIIGAAYMFMPMAAALVVQKLIYKEGVIGPLGISFRLNRWWLVAWLLPPVIAFATLGVSLLLPGIGFDPHMTAVLERFKELMPPERLAEAKAQMQALPIHPFWLALIEGLIAAITVNGVAGFGEEIGWRGLLQKELGSLGFWKMSAVIGVIWGIWHAPIILLGHNYPEHPHLGVLMMIAFTILIAPIFSYIRIKAKSVLAAAIFHGSLNGTMGLAVSVIRGGNDLTVGATGLAGFIVLALANLGIFLCSRRGGIDIAV